MHIETLKVFCDLVDMQSFSLAAERNFITQSAVSQQIRTLEEKFKRRLLERVRGRREVRLTPAGEVFYRECEKCSGELTTSFRKACAGWSARSAARLKSPPFTASGCTSCPPKVREFMSKFPSAKIDLEYSRTTRVVRDVLNGIGRTRRRRFSRTAPRLDDYADAERPAGFDLPARPRICRARSKLKSKELKGRDFVLFERDIPTRKATDKILKSYGVEVRKAAEFDNIETIKRAVEVGFGLAIVPHPSVMDEEKNKQLAVVQLAEKEWVRPVGVIYRSDRQLSIAAKKFVQLLENSQLKN